LVKDGEKYVLVRDPPGFDVDAVLFERGEEVGGEDILTTFLSGGHIKDYLLWNIKDYCVIKNYYKHQHPEYDLLVRVKHLWDEVQNAETEPWPTPNLDEVNARDPFDLIVKTDYAIIDVYSIDLEWVSTYPEMTRVTGRYRVISGRWYEERPEPNACPDYLPCSRLYPLTEGEVEVERVIETWRQPNETHSPPTALTRREERMVCHSFIDLPTLKLSCHKI
jgi:hypothetical protein